MRLPNQRSLARPEQINRKLIRHLCGVLSLALLFLAGCAGGTSDTTFANLFRGASPTPGQTAAAPVSTLSPTSSATPAAAETPERNGKKNAKQARAASENAAIASKEAANASAAAALASKQAASVANRIEGTGPSNADVSLESNPPNAASTPAAGLVVSRGTPASSPSSPMADGARLSDPRAVPTLSSPGLESAAPGESNPAKAAKLIHDVDRMQKRIDRKNLSADDSQRDILAQKLLQQATKALADRDSVAAISLATKASTLFAPLPKLADSAP
jgi:hypothetical protein